MRTKEEVKKQLFAGKEEEEVVKTEKNHVMLYILVASLAVLAIYTRFNTQQNQFKLTEAIQWTYSQLSFTITRNSERKNLFASLAIPIIFGIVTTIFSWMIVFFDSFMPGISPPSPLSPSKYRKQSGHNFHTAYVMALANGVACSILMSYWI
ncbi:ADP-ribosylation factor-like protein 6-interacting protein 6 [Centruroides vittatus]|uniref:ADP-ribosylation factor-like protein 6-interacting protein 6 n=1 Tax=Centruroides vittatus TaxID=120091 RepID=UPI00350F30D4